VDWRIRTGFSWEYALKLAAGSFLLSLYVICITNNIVDPDLWHEMALIREVVASGSIPLEDRFAYTPTAFPSVHHEWGAGAIAYFLATQFGKSGILAAKYVLAAVIALFVFLCLRKRSTPTELYILLLPVGILLIHRGFSTIRAQIYSFAFAACLLWFLEKDRAGDRKWMLAWLPLFLIWINLHGGFLVGFIILGCYWIGCMLRRKPSVHLLLTGIVMTGLISINPYGLDYYSYLFRAITMARPYIKEWQPIWITENLPSLSTFVFSILLIGYGVKKKGIRGAHGLLLLLATFAAAISCGRLVFFYAIVWMSYVPSFFIETPFHKIVANVWYKSTTLLFLLFFVATVLITIVQAPKRVWDLVVPGYHMERYGDYPIYPVGPVNYLVRNGFKGNMMVFFDWGSYIIWKLCPDVRVSMDSRYEVAYPEWVVKENVDFYRAKDGWQRTLSAYPTDLVLTHTDLPIARVMHQARGWKKIYEDREFQLYSRQGLALPVETRPDSGFMGTFP